MERTTEIIEIRSIDKFPSLDYIESIHRGKKLKIVFAKSINHLKEKVGEKLKSELPKFQIGIHTLEPEINISKLITDEEVVAHQKFFENCAKDYRILAKQLILEFIKKKKVKIDENFPFLAFNQVKGSKKSNGKINDWKYYFHGFHCHFKNIKTNQEIEVPIMFGMEFGCLDPYFFSLFIKSTPEYQPLPVDIYEDFADGYRILEVMVNLGLFERINSNLEHHSGIIIKDREKVEIKIFNYEKDYIKPKFDILKLFRLKSYFF
ncbi:hypothetical protein SAMN05421664_2293 [Chryseobacterium soldanellicola]|uniref:DUF6896 domain-containing protein n=1 Tax=Chryseobacterium soldanellicola TaxID=311333 RepID=A0A1H1D4T7_9FLAO|nr:hypothetical protein [Chryseobacterium soldanellicola]SDQ71473.1 hypothetical protein SAMN05421664_2293 [Chryseobacterium soldanellicola]